MSKSNVHDFSLLCLCAVGMRCEWIVDDDGCRRSWQLSLVHFRPCPMMIDGVLFDEWCVDAADPWSLTMHLARGVMLLGPADHRITYKEIIV